MDHSRGKYAARFGPAIRVAVKVRRGGRSAHPLPTVGAGVVLHGGNLPSTTKKAHPTRTGQLVDSHGGRGRNRTADTGIFNRTLSFLNVFNFSHLRRLSLCGQHLTATDVHAAHDTRSSSCGRTREVVSQIAAGHRCMLQDNIRLCKINGERAAFAINVARNINKLAHLCYLV